jgi:fructokinase
MLGLMDGRMQAVSTGVLCFGECVWDIYGSDRRLAGAPLNVAARCHSLGVPSTLLSAIGDDRAGDDMLEAVAALGVSVSLPVTDYPTGEVRVELDSAGVPSFVFKDEYAFHHIPRSDLRADAIYFGTFAVLKAGSQNALEDLFETIPFKAYDPNIRPAFLKDDPSRVKALLERYLPRASVLKVSEEEADVIDALVGLTPEQIHSRYGAEVFVTRGADGASYVGKYGRASAPSPRVAVVDTVGCGDAFMAYVLCGILNGQRGCDILAGAVAYASRVATVKGALADVVDEGTP